MAWGEGGWGICGAMRCEEVLDRETEISMGVWTHFLGINNRFASFYGISYAFSRYCFLLDCT